MIRFIRMRWLTSSPLWASAIGPSAVCTTNGWHVMRSFAPAVEYRTCPMPILPASGVNATGENTLDTSPSPLWVLNSWPPRGQVTIPQLSCPRCCSCCNAMAMTPGTSKSVAEAGIAVVLSVEATLDVLADRRRPPLLPSLLQSRKELSSSTAVSPRSVVPPSPPVRHCVCKTCGPVTKHPKTPHLSCIWRNSPSMSSSYMMHRCGLFPAILASERVDVASINLWKMYPVSEDESTYVTDKM